MKNLSCFLPGEKADDAPSPSLPRTRSKILRLLPWTPWIWGILGFCNNRVKKADRGLPSWFEVLTETGLLQELADGFTCLLEVQRTAEMTKDRVVTEELGSRNR